MVCLQLAHHEEKLVIMEQSLTTTQEQLSQRVSEVVKLEQTIRKQQTELKTMRERCASYEDEIHDQKETIGKQVDAFRTSIILWTLENVCNMHE